MDQETASLISKILAFLPIATLLLVFSCASAASDDKDAKFYNFFYYLNPRRGLASQWPLRFWLTTIITYSLATGVVCWSGYHLDFTPMGFATFVSISKFPLAIFSLTIPVGVFISRLHSTQQTAAQIEATDSKNRLDSFHAQRKGIVEYIDSIGEVELAPKVFKKLRVNQAFHSIIFHNSTHEKGADEADESAIKKVAELLSKALDHLAFLTPAVESLQKRHRQHSSLTLPLHYIRLVSITRRLCEHLMVLDYALTPGEKRKSINISSLDGQGNSQIKKLEILGSSYYEILAILNYCCTITFYAAISEHRERHSLKLIEISSLYKEIRSLCFGTSISNSDDPISKFAKSGGLYIQASEHGQLPELS